MTTDPFKLSKRKRKRDTFGAKPKRHSRVAKFGAPAKKQSRDSKFAAPPKKTARTWLKLPGQSKDNFGKVERLPKRKEHQVEGFGKRSPRLGGFIGKFIRKQRRAAELGRHWTLRDSIVDEFKRRQVLIESRLKNTGDEIGQLVTSISGKNLSGNQKNAIANYLDRKKQEITQGATLVEQVISLFGSLFSKVE